MKWNNLEKDFSNKIQKRSIAPTNDSWNQLETMLTSAEKSKPKRLIFWLSVAASITGIAFIGIYMMTQHDHEVINDPVLVVQENIVQPDSIQSNDRSEKEIFTNPIAKLKSSSELAEVKNIQSKKINKPSIATVEIISLIDKTKIDNTKQEKITIETKKININAQELLAAVENSGELKTQKTTIKIDPSSLLSQVNNELEQTFKEKAIQSINKNFNNLKTALASRNIDE